MSEDDRLLNQFAARYALDAGQAEISSRLAQKVDRDLISQRPGPSGQKLSYVEAHRVFSTANDVFRYDGWSSSIIDITQDYLEDTKVGHIAVGYSAIVRVTLPNGAFHEDIGYGSGSGPRDLTLEKAKKEAVTDAYKRALRLFGNLLGNSIYDKQHIENIRRGYTETTPNTTVSMNAMQGSVQMTSAHSSTSNPVVMMAANHTAIAAMPPPSNVPAKDVKSPVKMPAPPVAPAASQLHPTPQNNQAMNRNPVGTSNPMTSSNPAPLNTTMTASPPSGQTIRERPQPMQTPPGGAPLSKRVMLNESAVSPKTTPPAAPATTTTQDNTKTAGTGVAEMNLTDALSAFEGIDLAAISSFGGDMSAMTSAGTSFSFPPPATTATVEKPQTQAQLQVQPSEQAGQTNPESMPSSGSQQSIPSTSTPTPSPVDEALLTGIDTALFDGLSSTLGDMTDTKTMTTNPATEAKVSTLNLDLPPVAVEGGLKDEASSQSQKSPLAQASSQPLGVEKS